MPRWSAIQCASLRRESPTPTRPSPNSASIGGSGTLALVQCAASKHTLMVAPVGRCGHPGDKFENVPPLSQALGGSKKASDNWLDDPAQMRHVATAGVQSKPLAPPKLSPVTDSVV